MTEPSRGAKWMALAIVAILVAVVWWYVDWRSEPPEAPKVALPYAGGK